MVLFGSTTSISLATWDGLEVIEATQYGPGTSSFGKFSGDPQKSSGSGVKKDALFE